MPVREDLLKPISESSPSGVDAEDLFVLEEIRTERRKDADAQKLAVSGDLNEAESTDYARIVELAQAALAAESKDLWLAAYLTEALTIREGLSGLTAGIALIHGLLEAFWDSLYPPREENSVRLRRVPLAWLGDAVLPYTDNPVTLAVRRTSLTSSGVNLLQFAESQKIPREEEAKSSKPKGEARAQAINDKKITPEAFDAALKETPKAHLRAIEAEIKSANSALESLHALVKEKFGTEAPNFKALTTALSDLTRAVVKVLIPEKLKTDPDPAGAPEPVEVESEPMEGEPLRPAAPPLPKFADLKFDTDQLDALIETDLLSMDDTILRLAAVARYIRRNKPSSPVSYLLLRAFRWGELRDAEQLSHCLEAPPSTMRAALRQSFQTKNWQQVLEISGAAMGQPFGRGWLDLQRYSILACQELGYAAAAASIRSALKGLLADLPALPNEILPDDTGAANPETMAWLIAEGFWTPTVPAAAAKA